MYQYPSWISSFTVSDLVILDKKRFLKNEKKNGGWWILIEPVICKFAGLILKVVKSLMLKILTLFSIIHSK